MALTTYPASAGSFGGGGLSAYKALDTTYTSGSAQDDPDLQVTTPTGTYLFILHSVSQTANTGINLQFQMAHTGAVSIGKLNATGGSYGGPVYQVYTDWNTVNNLAWGTSDRQKSLVVQGSITVTTPGVFKARFTDLSAGSGLVIRAGSSLLLVKTA